MTKFSEIIKDCFKKCLDNGSPCLEQDFQKALQTSIDSRGTELNKLFINKGIFEPKVTINKFVELKTAGG